MKKRILSAFLSILMIFTLMVPVIPVSAAEKEQNTKVDSSKITILDEVKYGQPYSASNVFDGQKNWDTRWVNLNYPSYFIFQLENPYELKEMAVFVPQSNESPQEYKLLMLKNEDYYFNIPSDETKLSHLQDLNNWTELAHVSNAQMDQEIRTAITMTGSASVYRFEVLKGNSGNWTNVSEVEFSGIDRSYIHPTAISFDANGGSGTMKSVIVEQGKQFTLPMNGFTAPETMSFNGWLLPDGTVKQPGDTIAITEAITFKAIWKPIVYVDVRFHAGAGTGTMKPQTVLDGAYLLPDSTFTAPNGFHFAGWELPSGQVKPAGAVASINGNTVLYARYVRDEYVQVTFDANGGSGTMEPLVFLKNSVFHFPDSEFVNPGFRFDCWVVNGASFHSGDQITLTSDVSLQAGWQINDFCTIRYHKNGGYGHKNDENVRAGTEVLFENDTYAIRAPLGKVFDGLLINGTLYKESVRLKVEKNTEVIYQWKDDVNNPVTDLIDSGNIKIVCDAADMIFQPSSHLFDYDYSTYMQNGSVNKGLSWVAFELPAYTKISKFRVVDGGSDSDTYISQKYRIDALKNEQEYYASADKDAYLKNSSNWTTVVTMDNAAMKHFTTASVGENVVGSVFRFYVEKGPSAYPGFTYVRELEVFGTPVGENVTVTFDKGTFSDGTAPTTQMPQQSFKKNYSYTLPECGFDVKIGYGFAGWRVNRTGDIQSPGSVIQLSDDVTLEAVYDANTQQFINYIDDHGEFISIEKEKVNIVSDETIFGYDGIYYVPEGKTVNYNRKLYFNNNITIILGNRSVFKVKGTGKGTYSSYGNLTISACSLNSSEAGTFYSDATNEQCCGIGDANVLKINGGNIVAIGSGSYAGIGFDQGENVKETIYINGGKIQATGGGGAPGIGNCFWSEGEEIYMIYINGGEIDAIGGGGSVAIGTANEASVPCNVTFNGGKVTVKSGGPNIAAIGGGTYLKDAGVFTFNDGEIILPNDIANGIGTSKSQNTKCIIRMSKTALSKIKNLEFVKESRAVWQFFDMFESSKEAPDGLPIPLLVKQGDLSKTPYITFQFSLSETGEYSGSIPAVTEGGYYKIYVKSFMHGVDCGIYSYSCDIKGDKTLTADTEYLSSGTWTVDRNLEFTKRMEVCGNAVLHIHPGVTLKAYFGIHVPFGCSLTIEGEGTLWATQFSETNSSYTYPDLLKDNAILGSDKDESKAGDVYIKGGRVELVLNNSTAIYGSCIGGGLKSDAGKIVITGGKVIASLGFNNLHKNYGAMFGAGFSESIHDIYAKGGEVIINGGVVEIHSDSKDADNIGKGCNGKDPGLFHTGLNGHAIITMEKPFGDLSRIHTYEGMISDNGGRSYMVFLKQSTFYTLPEYNLPVEAGVVFKGWRIDNEKTLKQPGETVLFEKECGVTAVLESADDRKLTLKESSTLTLQDQWIMDAEEVFTVSELLAQFKNERIYTQVVTPAGQVVTDEKMLVPGYYKVQLVKDGVVLDTLTVKGKALPGDLNGDGVLNISDVTTLLNYLSDNSSTQLQGSGDLNGDASINIQDVTTLLNLLQNH